MGFVNNANNRSEELRKRRTQRSQQRMGVVNNRVMNPVNPRPVVMRGNSFGTPIHRQAGTTHARRQFYVTLDQASGTEIRLPALSLGNPGWRVLSAIIVLAAAVGIYSIWESPMFRVKSVDLRGPQRVTAADLTSALDLEDKRLIELSQSDIQAKLTESFPELTNVQLSIELPNFVTITAGERQPVLAWQKGDQTRWIDPEGIVFPARGEAGKLITLSSESDLPLAPVEINADNIAAAETVAATPDASSKAGQGTASAAPVAPVQVDPTLLKAAEALSQKLPPDTGLVYDKLNGLGWNDPQGYKVYIGKDLSQFDEKYAMYQKLASVLNEQGLKPSEISVEQLNAPFYRLEQ